MLHRPRVICLSAYLLRAIVRVCVRVYIRESSAKEGVFNKYLSRCELRLNADKSCRDANSNRSPRTRTCWISFLEDKYVATLCFVSRIQQTFQSRTRYCCKSITCENRSRRALEKNIIVQSARSNFVEAEINLRRKLAELFARSYRIGLWIFKIDVFGRRPCFSNSSLLIFEFVTFVHKLFRPPFHHYPHRA